VLGQLAEAGVLDVGQTDGAGAHEMSWNGFAYFAKHAAGPRFSQTPFDKRPPIPLVCASRRRSRPHSP
jgi:hypothetical protein